MPKKVRAAVVEAKSKMAIREFDMPEIGREDGLLKVEMVGVCGTDTVLYSGALKLHDFPFILGHEILGRVAKVGDIASKRWGVKEGDRVTMEALVRCGYCRNCMVGDYRFCENKIDIGFATCTPPPHLFGAYSEYLYLFPGSALYKISEKVPSEAAVLVNAVISNAVRWGRLVGDFALGDAVVIQGAGRQGLALVCVAKESGCNPIIVTGVSTDKERFALAEEFGADYCINVDVEDPVERVREITAGKMADVVVDVSGNGKTIPISIDMVRKQGKVVIASLTHSQIPINMDKIVDSDIKLVGVFTSDARSMTKAVKLVESRKYPLEKMVTHKFSLDEAEKAVQTAARYFKDISPIKCVIIP
jgi:alcohol dehydrogenase